MSLHIFPTKNNSGFDIFKTKKFFFYLFHRPSFICFKCPSSVFFSDLNKKKVPSFILSRCQNQNINIFMLKMNKKPEDQWSCKSSPDFFSGITTTVKREKWQHRIFRCSRAANSVVLDRIWPNFEPIQALIYD